MANPGYPMQPMMQPPMGQQQMGQMPQRQDIKRGTSKAVPVVVSAGLAVGVFCGLLFGLGTGKDEAVAATTTAETKKKADTDVPSPFQPSTPSTAPAKPATKPAVVSVGSNAVAPAGSNATAPAGSNAVAATGSNATGSAGKPVTVPPAAAKGVAKLTVEITPESVAKTAKITVDGKELETNVLEVNLGDAKEKEIKVAVKASGYKDFEGKVKMLADHENTTFTVELIKRSSSGNTGNVTRPPPPGGNTPPPAGKKPPGGKKPPTGIIDI
jgi:hypothetical protein